MDPELLGQEFLVSEQTTVKDLFDTAADELTEVKLIFNSDSDQQTGHSDNNTSCGDSGIHDGFVDIHNSLQSSSNGPDGFILGTRSAAAPSTDRTQYSVTTADEGQYTDRIDVGYLKCSFTSTTAGHLQISVPYFQNLLQCLDKVLSENGQYKVCLEHAEHQKSLSTARTKRLQDNVSTQKTDIVRLCQENQDLTTKVHDLETEVRHVRMLLDNKIAYPRDTQQESGTSHQAETMATLVPDSRSVNNITVASREAGCTGNTTAGTYDPPPPLEKP